MYVRFVTDRLDDDTREPVGVFAVAYELVDDVSVPEYLRTEMRKTLDWFKSNLPVPDQFARSRRPHRLDKGICWFKSSATECMSHVRYLVHLVSEEHVIVRELVTEVPGYAIYEDDFQVVAEPFATTPK